MARIAIIGTGIAGLSTARLLHRRHEITVYEKERQLGGHSRTVIVRHGDKDIPVDTGFIVFNERNYPNLSALFRFLGVRTHQSNMTFALTVRDGWLEWGAQSANAIFGQRRNVLRPAFLRLFAEVMRFNACALSALDCDPSVSLETFIARLGLSDWFRRYYILPMAGAIWSCPPRQMLSFPAKTFVQFFANHGLLSLTGQPQWRTVTGGATAYVEKLAAPFSTRIRTSCAAVDVTRHGGFVAVRDEHGNKETFDHVVLASHANDSLRMLSDASSLERAALGAFGYQKNRAVLHKDPQFMPKRKRCWASWVYQSDGTGEESAINVSYWMNCLQGIDPRCPLFVTLNPSRKIADDDVFDEHEFSHPVFDAAALLAQRQLKSLQGVNNTWFCGAHLGHGFHEDGLVSAMNVASLLGTSLPWQVPATQLRPEVRSPRRRTRLAPVGLAVEPSPVP